MQGYIKQIKLIILIYFGASVSMSFFKQNFKNEPLRGLEANLGVPNRGYMGNKSENLVSLYPLICKDTQKA